MNGDLVKHNDELQKEAQEVLTDLDLEAYFSHLGKVTLGGSVATGLMTWRDIDIAVLVKNLPSRRDLLPIVQHFLEFPQIKGVNVMDNLDQRNKAYPPGMYFGLTWVTVKEAKWKIDLWFVPENFTANQADVRWLQQKMTPEKRRAILQIKQAIHTDPRYKKTIFSVDIYKAVLEEGVTDLAGFREYLVKTGREL